jgi:NhaP-type Na+/H+ or K+/H+ antiporter
MWTTMVGYLPLTAVFAYVGSRLEELSLNDPILWIGAVVLVGLLLLTRRLARSLGLGDPA